MPPRSYNPDSIDAMFARLITRLDWQDKTRDANHAENTRILSDNTKKLDEIRVQTNETNGRVTILELRWKKMIGWIAGAGFVGSLVWSLVNLLAPFIWRFLFK